MTNEWYNAFLACVLLLWAVSTPRDRNALRIVLIASLASEVIVDSITYQIHGAWKLVIPGAVEIATILALLKWARNRTGILQASLLVFAWIAHVLCYVDVIVKSDIVYSRYESILFAVSVGQLATCYDTMHFNLQRAYAWAADLCSDCVLGISAARNRAVVSLVPADKKVPAVKGQNAAKHRPALSPRIT